ncbi:uncharacterized protein LOC135498673 [Lineus longissimus]|uniref:uncharacterized protein LOC135498673 n=1 Tax=Lineus longissimus TaxID=88925 RepID=UPI00315C9187
MAAMEAKNDTKKVRLPNFSQAEMVTLTQYAVEELSSLRAKFGPLITHEIKVSRWEAIANVISSLGVPQRSWEKVREKWNKMVSQAKTYNYERKKHAGGTGGGPALKIDPIKERIAEAFKDDPSFQGITGGTESAMPAPPAKNQDRREVAHSPEPSTSTGIISELALDEIIGQARSASKKEKETVTKENNETATPKKRSYADVLSLQFDVLQTTLENERMKGQRLKDEMAAAKVRKLASEELEALQKKKLLLEIQILQQSIETV